MRVHNYKTFAWATIAIIAALIISSNSSADPANAVEPIQVTKASHLVDAKGAKSLAKVTSPYSYNQHDLRRIVELMNSTPVKKVFPNRHRLFKKAMLDLRNSCAKAAELSAKAIPVTQQGPLSVTILGNQELIQKQIQESAIPSLTSFVRAHHKGLMSFLPPQKQMNRMFAVHAFGLEEPKKLRKNIRAAFFDLEHQIQNGNFGSCTATLDEIFFFDGGFQIHALQVKKLDYESDEAIQAHFETVQTHLRPVEA